MPHDAAHVACITLISNTQARSCVFCEHMHACCVKLTYTGRQQVGPSSPANNPIPHWPDGGEDRVTEPRVGLGRHARQPASKIDISHLEDQLTGMGFAQAGNGKG